MEVWQSSAPLPPPAGTFYRAINVGGPATVIDGHNWEGEATTNYGTNSDPNPFSLKNSLGYVVPATLTYDAVNRTARLQPSSALNGSSNYTATVKGGATGVSDLAGNRLPNDVAWTFATGTAVPAAPSSLVATAVSSTQISLFWNDNSSNETGFKIERKTGAGGTYSQIATVAAGVTGYSNTGLTAGTTYFYRVRATNAAGDSAYSNEASAASLAVPAFRAAASSAAASGALTINKPTGTVQGDVMVASISVRPNTATITAPSGWTLVRRLDNTNTTANSLAVYYKVAGSSEPDELRVDF